MVRPGGQQPGAEPWLDESFAQYSHERLHPFINICVPASPASSCSRRRGVPLDAGMGRFERASARAIGEVVSPGGLVRAADAGAPHRARAHDHPAAPAAGPPPPRGDDQSDVLGAIGRWRQVSAWPAGCASRTSSSLDLGMPEGDTIHRAARRVGAALVGTRDRIDRDAAAAPRAGSLARAAGRPRGALGRRAREAPVHPLRGRPHAALAPAHDRPLGRLPARPALAPRRRGAPGS